MLQVITRLKEQPIRLIGYLLREKTAVSHYNLQNKCNQKKTCGISVTLIISNLCLCNPLFSNSFRSSEKALLFPKLLFASFHRLPQSIVVLHITSSVCHKSFHSSRYNWFSDWDANHCLMLSATPKYLRKITVKERKN